MSLEAKMCYGKRAYSTEDKALKAVKVISMQSGKKFRAYPCPLCAEWHLSSKPLYEVAEPPVVKPPAAPVSTRPKCPDIKKVQYDSMEEAQEAEPLKVPFLCASCKKWHTVKRKPDDSVTP